MAPLVLHTCSTSTIGTFGLALFGLRPSWTQAFIRPRLGSISTCLDTTPTWQRLDLIKTAQNLSIILDDSFQQWFCENHPFRVSRLWVAKRCSRTKEQRTLLSRAKEMLVMYCPALHPIVTHLLKISTTLSSQNIFVRFPSKNPPSIAICSFVLILWWIIFKPVSWMRRANQILTDLQLFFDQIENAGRGSLLIVQVTWK